MTRKTEIDFPPVTFSKSVTDSLTENNQKGDMLKEVCECVEGKECQGRKVLSHSMLMPLIFLFTSKLTKHVCVTLAAPQPKVSRHV